MTEIYDELVSFSQLYEKKQKKTAIQFVITYLEN